MRCNCCTTLEEVLAIAKCKVSFKPSGKSVEVERGTLLHEAAQQAGLDINMPCGGQGRCGRCAVLVEEGAVDRRSTLRLSAEDVAQGYALACQTAVLGDAVVFIPPQEQVVRHIATERTAARVELPFPYDWRRDQTLHKCFLRITPPSLDDNTDDFSRLRRELERQHSVQGLTLNLPVARKLGS